MIRELFLLGAVALFQSAAPVTGPVGFRPETLLAHRLSGETGVAVPVDGRRWYGEVEVRVTIGADGAVTDARVDRDGNRGEQDPAAALAAARAFRFRPFTYRGSPVSAVGLVSIRYVAAGAGGWRDPEAGLPPIDYAHLKITLIRSACFGSCPDYRVTIDGAGTVVFSTQDESVPGAAEVHRAYSAWNGVLIPGTHRTTIDRATLDALIERFRAVHFFGLRKDYAASVTDNPTQVVGFASGGKSWEVTDYVGQEAGMPAAVDALEDAIDEAAGTARWVRGDANTVPALLADDFDPRSEDAQQLALQSAQSANGRVAADLVAAGLPLDVLVDDRDRKVPLGAALLGWAANRGQPELFAAVAARGWLARMPRAALGTLFAESGGGCDPAVARAMVAAGADPNARTGSDPHDMGSSAGARTALMTALHSYQCDDAAKPALAAALLKLGVDINAVDDHGESAIFGVEDPELLDALLAAGARADLKGKDGKSAAFSSWTDAIVLRLLDAGADPQGIYSYDKKTLRQMAHERDMPAVLAWLDARGVK